MLLLSAKFLSMDIQESKPLQLELKSIANFSFFTQVSIGWPELIFPTPPPGRRGVLAYLRTQPYILPST